MSVIIKGMEKPDSCYDCRMRTDSYFCSAKPKEFCGYTDDIKRPDWCPLIELPPHGRLIDAKQLKEKVLKWMPPDPCGVEEKEYPFETDICVSMLMEIDEAPTFLEAEAEE